MREKKESKHKGLGLKAHTPELFLPKTHDSRLFFLLLILDTN
jgi:hypothetical protein